MEFKITKEQLLSLYERGCFNGIGDDIKTWFPDAFKPSFEVGIWYRHKSSVTPMVNYQGGKSGFGFDGSGYWNNTTDWSFESQPLKWVKASFSEIFKAFEKEYIKRYTKTGFKCLITGEKYNSLIHNVREYSVIDNTLIIDGYTVFKKGQWAENIEPSLEITIEEIAERFGVSASQIKIKK